MTATKKPTTPRKRAQTSPANNGEAAVNGKSEPAERPPEEYVIREPDKPETPPHPYGDKQVFVFQPKGDYPPIIFPHVVELRPTPKFFWKIYGLNEMYQAFEWMNFAEIPRDIQEQVMDLGERDVKEQAEFFRLWFEPLSRPQGGPQPPGES